MPTFGSLFSGIGGIDLGLERAGWTCSWQVELDERCRAVLARHWPSVPRWADVRNAVDLAPVDLIAGGFPCQPVSVAGQRRGQDDERWLWPEFARIVRLLRPRYVFVENVTGLLARGMGDVLGDLAASGYDAEWDCLPAAAFGAPHLRYRVCVVAYAAGDGWQAWGTEPAGFFGAPWPERSGWWATEPDVARVATGLSERVDRVAELGNAVVPQLAEWIGRRLVNADSRPEQEAE